jgi:polyisoprenoid-binding protein YceI
VYFEVGHLGYSIQRGRFEQVAGKIRLDGAAQQGTLDIVVSAASVTTGFAQRDEQLRGVEFFNVARFPTVTFRSTEMKFVGERPISAKGVLTLLGVSKPVELKISQFYCAPHPMSKKEMCGAEANVSIKRSEYGMNRYLPGIGDEVKLAVQIEAFRD